MKKDFVARELTREIIVGTFVVMIFLGLGYFTIILSREAWFQRTYEMEVLFDEVMGLREGDNVTVRGMPVGKVGGLRLEGSRVHVQLRLEQRLHMKKNYAIQIVPLSILGGRYVDVYEGSPDYPDVPLSGRFVGRKPIDLVADAGELVSNAKREFIEGGIIDDIREASAKMREVAERLHGGKGVLGRLMSEDDTLYKDLAGTVAALRAVTERLEAGEGALGKLMTADSALFEDLEASAASLRDITAKLEKGEGALGKLMSDEAVYDDVQAIIHEARAALDDYRETSPVVTFTSVFFGAL